tara:strand:- start:143 stop:1357 length:1215 start_codon:yes stop_codon:yes gene_type:complete
MKNHSSLLLICQVFHPDDTSTSQLFSALMRQLQSQGVEVMVLCGFPSYMPASDLPRKETWQGIKIQRCGLRLQGKRSLFFRSISYFFFLLESFFRLLTYSQVTHWLGVTNPPFVAWTLALASLIHRHSFHFFFLDLHPEGLIAIGGLPADAWYVSLWKKLNHWSYQRAKHLLVLGRDMTSLLSHHYRLPVERFSYLPHWSATEMDFPLEFHKSVFVQRWQLENKFVVQYSGNMGLWHDIENFVRCANDLEGQADMQFVFIGNGRRLVKAKQLAAELDVSNVQWHDFVPIDELSHSLASCHVSLISLRAGLEGVAVPCKLYGILASGRAVVAQVPLESEVALTVKDHQCGVVVDPSDVSLLVKQLKSLSQQPELVAEMGRNAFAAYQQHYSLEQAAKRFKQILSL